MEDSSAQVLRPGRRGRATLHGDGDGPGLELRGEKGMVEPWSLPSGFNGYCMVNIWIWLFCTLWE